MISNGKPTRNADLRHAQSIARQRQAVKIAAPDVSTENLTDLFPHDESPMLPDAAPANESRPSWRDTVAIVTLRAKDTMGAAYHSRLDKAQWLVLAGHVNPHDDGHSATVQSETKADETYAVNGACECPDARTKAPAGFCKHRLAWAIFRRAVEHGQLLLEQRLPAPAAPTPTGRPQDPLPEAPVSITLKGTVHGCPGTLVTVRGTTLAQVKAQLAEAAALFDALPDEQPQRIEVPSALHVGTEAPEAAPYCFEHGMSFYKNHKNGHTWWSHRIEGGKFCRYKG